MDYKLFNYDVIKNELEFNLWTVSDFNHIIPDTKLFEQIIYCTLTSFFLESKHSQTDFPIKVKALKGSGSVDFKKQLLTGRKLADGKTYVGFSSEIEKIGIQSIYDYIFTYQLKNMVHLIISDLQQTKFWSAIGFHHQIERDERIEVRLHWLLIELKTKNNHVSTLAATTKNCRVYPKYNIAQESLGSLVSGLDETVRTYKSETIFEKDKQNDLDYFEYNYTFNTFNFYGMKFFDTFILSNIRLGGEQEVFPRPPLICLYGYTGNITNDIKTELPSHLQEVFDFPEEEFSVCSDSEIDKIIVDISSDKLIDFIKYTKANITIYKSIESNTIILILEYKDRQRKENILGGVLKLDNIKGRKLLIQKHPIKYIDQTNIVPCLGTSPGVYGTTILKWLNTHKY